MLSQWLQMLQAVRTTTSKSVNTRECNPDTQVLENPAVFKPVNLGLKTGKNPGLRA